MEIYQPGTKVTINKFDGVILTVELSPTINGVFPLYNVAWWSGATRNTAWLREFEFTSQEPKRKIGFRGAK